MYKCRIKRNTVNVLRFSIFIFTLESILDDDERGGGRGEK